MIGKEDVKLSKKQLEELIELMEKEEVLEVEDQIQRALEKDNNDNEKDKPEEIFGNIESISNPQIPFVSVAVESSSSEDLNCSESSSLNKNSKSIHENAVASQLPSSPKKAEGPKQL